MYSNRDGSKDLSFAQLATANVHWNLPRANLQVRREICGSPGTWREYPNLESVHAGIPSLSKFLTKGRAMKSPIVKRSVLINGHKTSVSLEEGFWEGLKDIARLNGKTTRDLIGEIERTRTTGNFSSALRLFVLEHYRENGSAVPVENTPGGQAASAAPL